VRVLLVGAGAVGARAGRQLVEAPEVDAVVLAGASDRSRAAVAEGCGPKVHDGGPGATSSEHRPDVVALAGPAGTHVEVARAWVERGVPVVSCGDGVDDVQGLLGLGSLARDQGVAVVAGAGFSPGYTCLLARHAAARFDRVEEIHVARRGTGGPACARQHHRALSGVALDWRDGGWQERRGGSGRELCWFPDPIGAADCYRAELPDALVLVPEFPQVVRVTARLAASRRDRLTAHLPMLRRPHPEGLVGAVRVEVRGRVGSAQETVVLGALDRPAVATGAVLALAARSAADGAFAPGAAGLAAVRDPLPMLQHLADIGIRAAIFEGGA
jgi:saccharopine dehydrogenase-like NADP-dependent oxidoreductase